VTFAIADSLRALNIAGTSPERVMAVGGGSRSALWLKMLATALAVPVDVPADGDFGAAFGAARLGLIAAERADPASVLAVPAIAATHEPDASLSAAFAERLQRYRRLYPAIRSLDS
jgi:xylulokinase